MRPREGILLSY
jgi:cytochrome oxidase assembly protein ShyY1